MQGANEGGRQLSRRLQSWLKRSRKQLERDFDLTLMGLCSLLAIALILPFAGYRLYTGNLLAALGNVGAVFALIGAFLFARITGRTHGIRYILAIVMASICIYMLTVVGHTPYWVFPVLVGNFMLVAWPVALLINLLVVIAVAVASPHFPEPVFMLSFLASATMVGTFSLLFTAFSSFHRDKLGALVERDPLTGAFNRRALVAHLEESLASAEHLRREHALVVLDLDDFKTINDRYGHETGDRVLIAFTGKMIREGRRGDLVYRLGGDEFVLLLSNTDRNGAEIAVRKLHRQLDNFTDREAGAIRVSIGAAVSRPDESWQGWLARADRAMYQAKASGKHQVVIAD